MAHTRRCGVFMCISHRSTGSGVFCLFSALVLLHFWFLPQMMLVIVFNDHNNDEKLAWDREAPSQLDYCMMIPLMIMQGPLH